MKKIQLNKTRGVQGHFALVDDEDFAWLDQWKWCYKEGYVARTEFIKGSGNKFRFIRMHRLILGLANHSPGELEGEHKNGNGLDNRRSNLRTSTRSQNMANTSRRSTNKTGFKGVSRLGGRSKRYAARIMINYKVINLGNYLTPQEAHKVYSAKAKELFGEFAKD